MSPPVRAPSNEQQLLLSLMRAALHGKGTVRPTTSIEWPKFTALVEHHRVGAWLYHRIPEELAALCPAEVLDTFRAIAGQNIQAALTRSGVLVSLAGQLEAAGFDFLVVKGLALAEPLYGGLGIRQTGDLDLLIRSSDALRLDALLQATGWERTEPAFPLTPLQAKKYLRLKPEFEYQKKSLAVRLEVRWELEGLTDFEAAKNCSVPWTLGGQTMRTLPADLNVLYLFQHGARHGWFRLFWLVDVALILRRRDFEAETTLAVARKLGVERSLLQGGALVEEWLDVPRAAALRPADGERSTITWLTTRARRIALRDPAEAETVAEWLRRLVYRMRLQRTLRDKIGVVTPHLFTPESWAMWRLPDRWFFLYYPATPLLWIWRRVRYREYFK